jgi:type VI protein secretion system component Hcp
VAATGIPERREAWQDALRTLGQGVAIVFKAFRLAIAAVAALAAGPAAAVDYLVKVDGIPGTSNLVRMTDYIPVQSWSLGFNKGVCQTLTFVKTMDASSAALTAAALSGVVYPQIILVARHPGEQPYNFMRLVLTNSVFTSFKTGGSTIDGSVPTETISAQPSSVKTELYEMTASGTKALVASSIVDCPPR